MSGQIDQLDQAGAVDGIAPAGLEQPRVDNRYALRLRVLRALSGLSPHAVAHLAGLPEDHYEAYEAGRRRVTAAALMRLAPALGITTSLFFEAD